ncbi:MAG: thiol reductant ABC exporter subunit CydD, partial [Anaerolineales bacterium]|nr:thiol reductant ABC exporter subunit CydD [Anaerolineales bacterium]
MSRILEGSEPPGSFFNLDGRLLAQARTARTELIATIGLGSISGICQVYQAWFLSKIVNLAFLESAGLQELMPYIGSLAALALFKAGLTWGTHLTAGRAAGRVKKTLRDQMADHLIELGPPFVHQERTGELSNTATEGIEALTGYISEYLPQVALAALVPLTVLMFVFPLDPLTGVIMIVTAPLIPIFMWLIGSVAKSITQKQWLETSLMSAHFLDMLQGLATLKALGNSSSQALSIGRVANQYRQVTMNVLKVTFLSALVLEMAATISTAVIAVQIGLRLMRGSLVFQPAFFILLLAPEFYQPLRKLGARFHAGMAGITAAGRIFQFLEKPAVSIISPVECEEPVPMGDICFTDVNFAYEKGRRPALKNYSLKIDRGRHVALVGPTGAGKSTVAHLLLRFIEPDRGEIFVGKKKLQEIPISAWREQVAWVSPKPYLFNGTVLDNIGLGLKGFQEKDPGPSDFERIEWAARQAHAYDFIKQLPQGYHT